jgi:hypothetical protein
MIDGLVLDRHHRVLAIPVVPNIYPVYMSLRSAVVARECDANRKAEDVAKSSEMVEANFEHHGNRMIVCLQRES